MWLEIIKLNLIEFLITAYRNVNSWNNERRALFESVYGNQLQIVWSKWLDACTGQSILVPPNIISNIKCQTLILHGGKDFIVGVLHAKYLHQNIRQSKLHLFNANHNCHLEKTSEFVEVVQKFLCN